MDPVQAAKDIIDSLVEEELKAVNEAYNEDEEENEDSESEGEEGEDEGNENKPSRPQQQQSQAPRNQASVSMKPAQFAGSGNSGGLVQDAHGGGVRDAHGGGDILGTKQYTDYSAQNQASVSMKPSFATAGGTMSEEKVREDILNIFGGSEELSEEFINKAGSIYESAVMGKVQQIATEIHEQYETAFAQEVEEVKTLLTEKIDQYLNYVVDEWMNENKLAVENGIRTEIAENFIGKLKDLFVESYIEVPQNKTNLFDEMAETIETLETRVNEEMQKNVSLVNENNAVRAVSIFMESTKDLTDVQVDKVQKLVENLEYINESDFADKVQTIVENVTKQQIVKENKKSVNQVNNKYLVEETVIEEESSGSDHIDDPNIRLYSQIIAKSVQN